MPFALSLMGRWLPVAVFVGVIAFEAGTPGLTFVPGSDNDLLVRKLGHAAAYGLLALLVRWALREDGASGRRSIGDRRAWIESARAWVGPLLVTAVVAIADELWQNGSAGREAKLTDVLTDLTGAFAALLLVRTWHLRRSFDRRRARAVMAPVPDADLVTRGSS